GSPRGRPWSIRSPAPSIVRRRTGRCGPCVRRRRSTCRRASPADSIAPPSTPSGPAPIGRRTFLPIHGEVDRRRQPTRRRGRRCRLLVSVSQGDRCAAPSTTSWSPSPQVGRRRGVSLKVAPFRGKLVRHKLVFVIRSGDKDRRAVQFLG